ncbi:hypothetical protein PBI_HILLTOPFARM_85 [Mycobacterium phage Hilltopfarm]|nr:hypothetical protein PBI_HILLTOPFARM_85 [Mycobacterium phage Hilltopfarm]
MEETNPKARAVVEQLVQSFSPAATAMMTEAAVARVRYPAFNSAHEGWAVLYEEVDEMWDEVRADNLERAIAEAIQVGAMAIRFVTEMRQRLYGERTVPNPFTGVTDTYYRTDQAATEAE